jgi:peptidoglycan hydrolase-like protein with peptidoglycan-binding domain
MVVAGALGFAPTLSSAQDMPQYDIAPNVPGVTDDHDNRSTMSRDDVRQLEQTLADAGYDPGAIDGVVDDQTQAASASFKPITRW